MYVQGASHRGRHTPPTALAQEGKVHRITRSGQGSTIECSFNIVVASWRFNNAKSPAAMLQEKQLGRHTYEYNTVRIPF